MSPFSRVFLLVLFSLLAACQRPSLEDRYQRKRVKQAAAKAAVQPQVDDDADWAPALPGPDLTREEALAFATREVLTLMTPEQRLPILTALIPDESSFTQPADAPPLPVFDVPGLCGDDGPLCAAAARKPELVRLPEASQLPPAVVIAHIAHEQLVRWSPREKAAVDYLPPVEVLVTVLAELTSRLGSEELAVAALLLGHDIERRIEVATAKAQRPPTLSRVSSWVNRRSAPVLARAKEALTLTNLYALSWPVSHRWSLTSRFGYRVHPIYGTLRLHKGVDIAVPTGTEVRAPSAATVSRSREDPRNGKWIQLDHGNGITTVYCHASELKLTKGTKVNEGDVIALSGETGVATGPHLHYQLHVAKAAVDPLRFRAAMARTMFDAERATAAGGRP